MYMCVSISLYLSLYLSLYIFSGFAHAADPFSLKRGTFLCRWSLATMPRAVFVLIVMPFWDHVGSILEVSGTLR